MRCPIASVRSCCSKFVIWTSALRLLGARNTLPAQKIDLKGSEGNDDFYDFVKKDSAKNNFGWFPDRDGCPALRSRSHGEGAGSGKHRRANYATRLRVFQNARRAHFSEETLRRTC